MLSQQNKLLKKKVSELQITVEELVNENAEQLLTFSSQSPHYLIS